MEECDPLGPPVTFLPVPANKDCTVYSKCYLQDKKYGSITKDDWGYRTCIYLTLHGVYHRVAFPSLRPFQAWVGATSGSKDSIYILSATTTAYTPWNQPKVESPFPISPLFHWILQFPLYICYSFVTVQWKSQIGQSYHSRIWILSMGQAINWNFSTWIALGAVQKGI